MERYDATEEKERTHADAEVEWSSAGPETGLEESMWQLGLAGGGGTESYPEKTDAPDCIYYLRTGFCGYGARCRFNHPRDRNSAMGDLKNRESDYPERMGQPVCQYYMRTGMCKFGASCKYHHPRHGVGSPNSLVFNFCGYPLRPGEKECSFYMKTGNCKFGATCKFHHPQPAGMHVPTPSNRHLSRPDAMSAPLIYPLLQSSPIQSSEQYGLVTGNWSVARPAVLPGSYLPATYGPMVLPQGMVPVSGWSTYPVGLAPGGRLASSGAEFTVGEGPIYGITQLSPLAPLYEGPYLSVPSSDGHSEIVRKEHIYPNRPRQPVCRYYLKTGDCKFGSLCRYHHPGELSASQTSVVLSPMALPLRMGAPLCSDYAQNGVCKFGPSCKFDHPMGTLSYSPSTSSLVDVPVAPYPVGSSIGILAPSSSSSNLRAELISGSKKNSFSASISCSMTQDVSHSSAQQSGQQSFPSTGSSGNDIGDEVRTSS